MAIAEPIDFHGMPAVRWRSADGASAVATLQGAHLVSWIPAGGAECLYVSERSAFEPGNAIRGGVPVVFPQFADRGPLIKHGFARNLPWRFTAASETDGGSLVVFELRSSPQTLAQWPREFHLQLTATIGGPRLDVQLRIANSGHDDFSFMAALHTYLRVSDAAAVRLVGLTPDAVTAAEPIDRVYFATPPVTRLEDEGRALSIEQRGFVDTVVWNPGREITAGMADMPPDGYRHMLCVEAAVIGTPVVLAPDAAWSGGQSIRIST